MKHPVLRLAITAVISLLALYFAFRGVHFHDLMGELALANVPLIFFGVFTLFLAHVCRAWRWTVILRPMKAKTSVFGAFKAIMAGYGMNNIIPRSGELIRPYIFAKHEKLFMSGTVATIMVERVVDLISNLIAMLLALLLFPQAIAQGFPSVADIRLPVILVILALLGGVVAMIFSTEKTERFIHHALRTWPEKLRVPISRGATAFANGLAGIRAGGALPVALGTLGIWLFYVLSMYIWLFAFPEKHFATVGIIGAFFLRVVSGIAFLIPTPGGVGSYHFFISQALFRIFGVPLISGIAYATVTNAAFNSLTIVIGLIILASEGISFKNFATVTKVEQEQEASHKVDSELPVVRPIVLPAES